MLHRVAKGHVDYGGLRYLLSVKARRLNFRVLHHKKGCYDFTGSGRMKPEDGAAILQEEIKRLGHGRWIALSGLGAG
jgi:hypothetical protein